MESEQHSLRAHLRAIGSAMQALGLEVERVSRLAGLARPVTAHQDADVTAAHFQALWRAVGEETRDPAIALRLGAAVPFGAYELVDYLGSSCRDVGDCFTQVGRYFGLITTSKRWRTLDAAEPPVVEMASSEPAEVEADLYVKYTSGIMIARMREVCGVRFPLVSVDLEVAPPVDPTPYTDFFGCPVRFGASPTRFAISRVDWQRPLMRADTGLKAVLERHADQMARARGVDDPLREVRVAVRGGLRRGVPRLDDVAKALALSSRTLQRRLGDASTTFQDVVDDERRAGALSLLRQAGLSVSEVAYLLGYSEPSAFLRAFKRWTGETPREYRTARQG